MYKQKDILQVAQISRQAFHKHFKKVQKRDLTDSQLVNKVALARTTMEYRKMGARTLYYALEIDKIGINRFEQLLSSKGFNVVTKRNYRKTTNGSRWQDDVNRVKNTSIDDINKVILGDITYLSVHGIFYYIYTLKDAYSKRIVGLYGSRDLEATSAVSCLKQAIRLRGSKALKECIHHSDAGVQYKSNLYRNSAKYLRWSIAANCLENGMAEQLNFILKDHFLEGEKIKNVKQLNSLLCKVKKIINEKRPVKQLGYKTPVAYEKSLKNIPIEQRTVFTFKDPDKRGMGKGDFREGISMEESLNH
ncbi:MAG: DDE-type integrase/transposase/recombinase [Chitinophagales bacterium]|nr:DDE-type integrase/transposase/recombinase [Chitinophagales bacterium]